MTRREILQYATAMVGYSLTASLASAVMGGCRAEAGVAFKPEFLSPSHANMVSAIAELFLPKTDTPGAIEAGVPQFIDQAIGKYLKPEHKKRFETALQAFADDVQKKYNSPFESLSLQEQGEALLAMGKAQDFVEDKDKKDQYSLFRQLKEYTLTGYASSELGATKLLNSVPVPGRFQGCITLKEAGGKQFAPNI